MELEFYRCEGCSRLDEVNKLLKRGSCICMRKRIVPVLATTVEVIWFLLCNPSYFFKGDKK